jgi:hypothetical protein
LDWRTSRVYQQAAEQVADQRRILRVHLDAVWWGARDADH